MIFPYLSQYHSTPSLINNPDSYHTFSQFSPFNNQSFSDHFQTQTSTNDISYDSTPKYQNLSHSPSLNDNFDNTIDSTDSDFETLPNPIYYSNSSENSFPTINPCIADSPTTFTPIKFSQNLKPLHRGPYKILKHLSDVTYELMSQDRSTFQLIEMIYYHFILKNR